MKKWTVYTDGATYREVWADSQGAAERKIIERTCGRATNVWAVREG